MMPLLAYVQAHSVMILSVLLMVSEAMALIFPQASGILKAISLLKSAGAKDASGQ